MQPDAQAPTILLVHGAWHGSWYWEEGFAPWLREQGHTVETIDLPGHDQPGRHRIPFYSIRAYADAVEAAVERSARPVVAVGHSMGGHVVQKLMERRPTNLTGAALLASVPPQGVLRVVLYLLRTHPVTLLRTTLGLDMYQVVRKPELAHELFYTPDFDPERVAHYWKQAQGESFRAFLDMLMLNLPRPSRADPALPKWVMGGELDVIFPPKTVYKTARAYGVDAHIYPGMAHSSMVLEPGWEKVASELSNWVKNLQQPSARKVA